jgi:hypothetical protein
LEPFFIEKPEQKKKDFSLLLTNLLQTTSGAIFAKRFSNGSDSTREATPHAESELEPF